MTDLNLSSSTPAPTAAAPAANSVGLVLNPPAPVQIVKPEQAVELVPVDTSTMTALQQKAHAWVGELSTLDTRSPAFSQKIAQVTSLGDTEMRQAASSTSRMLDRPAAAMGKNGKTDNAQGRVSNTLVDLRTTITELDPRRADLKGVKKVLKFLPGGDKVNRYFLKYQSAQSHLNAIITALASGQDELRKDNAAIETEKQNMWAAMGKLREYNELASALDAAIEARIGQLEAAGQTEDANTMRSDALFPVRQRRQDIQTQMAVNVQGYLALDLIKNNNNELIRGVDRAQTTTMVALRTAVIVSQALGMQKRVLDQVNSLNETTSGLIEATSEQMRTQGVAIHEQAASATIQIEKLQAAFDNVFQTMDAIDTFRTQAVNSMAETISALEGQVERAKPYLERTRARELGAGN